MKKWTLLSTLFCALLFNAQCTINGKNTLNIGETVNYSVDMELAQCTDCHLWTYAGNGINLEGDTRKNTVTVRGANGGRAVISVTYLSSMGISQCSKNIDVLASGGYADNNAGNTNPSQVNCDVQVANFKEVKVDDGVVSFFPQGDNGNFNYEWTALYVDGSTKTSKDKVPQFTFTPNVGILKISAKITSNICYKTLSKTYDVNYWKSF